MKEIIRREEHFLNKALHRTAWLGLLIALLLFVVYSRGAAIGFFIGVGTILGLTLFYQRLVARFARPEVRKGALPRALILLASLKYPLLILISYWVVQGGLPMTLGFLGGVSLFLLVLIGMAVWPGGREG